MVALLGKVSDPEAAGNGSFIRQTAAAKSALRLLEEAARKIDADRERATRDTLVMALFELREMLGADVVTVEHIRQVMASHGCRVNSGQAIHDMHRHAVRRVESA